MTRVRKPCPACKGTDHARPDAASICYKCQGELEAARKILAIEAARVAKTSEVSWFHTLRFKMWSWWPKICLEDCESDIQEELQKAFVDLTATISQETDRKAMPENVNYWRLPLPYGGRHQQSRNEHERIIITIPLETAQALDRLFNAVSLAVEACQEAGFHRGHDLLRGLANGSMSIKEYNQTVQKKN